MTDCDELFAMVFVAGLENFEVAQAANARYMELRCTTVFPTPDFGF